MKLRLLESLFLLLAVLVSDHLLVHAAAPLAKVLVTTGSASEREGALYVAQDQGFFRRYGVDLTLVQARNGPVGMAALSSGESFMHWGSVSGANLGAISEGADLVFVAGFINRLTGVFAANPKIKSPTDLRGKSLGVNSLSGGTWIFTMLTLDHWGLSPERDKIQMRGLGDSSIVSQALLAGNIDAAYLSYSFAKVVENKGFRVLADLQKLPIAYQGTGIVTRRSTIASSAATLENVIRGLLDGVAFIRNPENKSQVAEKPGQRSALETHRRRRRRISKHARPLRKKNLSRASTACATSSASSVPVTKRSAASKQRNWWTTAL